MKRAQHQCQMGAPKLQHKPFQEAGTWHDPLELDMMYQEERRYLYNDQADKVRIRLV